MNARSIAHDFFISNKYQTMKELEQEEAVIKQVLKSRMGDNKRLFHKETGVVLKFIPYNNYLVDNLGLNDFLHSYGVLESTVKFNDKDLSLDILNKISEFRNESEYYVRINPKRLKKKEFDLEDNSTDDLIERWLVVKRKLDVLEEDYEQARKLMNECKELQYEGNVKFQYGSISRIKKDNTYDIGRILKKYGSDFVIKHAKSVSSKIEEFIYQGYFLPSEINQFKMISGTTNRFVIMTAIDESSIMNNLGYRKSKASIRFEQIKRQII